MYLSSPRRRIQRSWAVAQHVFTNFSQLKDGHNSFAYYVPTYEIQQLVNVLFYLLFGKYVNGITMATEKKWFRTL